MDEESPKKKISVNSFFERVDSVDKVASSALSKSDSVMNVANANKLLIESLQLTVETMQTEIRDIANYIIVENKLEKDLKEDRLLEEQDAQQKKDISEKLLGLKGSTGPAGPQGLKGEDFGSKEGGGSFLGGLLEGLATLGAGAFALKFMWPALLPVVKGALGSAVGGGIKFLGGAVGKTLIGILGGIPLIGAAAKLIGGGIERTANKAGDGLEKSIESMGEDGKINIPTYSGGGGRNNPPKEVDKEVEPEKKENKLLEFVKKGGVAGFLGRKIFGGKKDEGETITDKEDDSKKLTTERELGKVVGGDATQEQSDLMKRQIDIEEEIDFEIEQGNFKRVAELEKESEEIDKKLFNLGNENKLEDLVQPEKKEKKENKLLEFVKKGGVAGFLGRKIFGGKKDEKKMRDKDGPDDGVNYSSEQKLNTEFDTNTGKAYVNGVEVDPQAYVEFKSLSTEEQLDTAGAFVIENRVNKIEPVMESKDVGSLEIPKVNQTNNSNDSAQNVATLPPSPIAENTTPLVQASPPQVSSAMIKPTEAPIPFRKLISSKKYLSVSDMPKSGLPPQIAKMIS